MILLNLFWTKIEVAFFLSNPIFLISIHLQKLLELVLDANSEAKLSEIVLTKLGQVLHSLYVIDLDSLDELAEILANAPAKLFHELTSIPKLIRIVICSRHILRLNDWVLTLNLFQRKIIVIIIKKEHLRKM